MKTDVQYFQCNRTGVYVSTGTGQRRIKSQGSCKIQQNCTAGIKITTKKDNTVLAEICHTHYGHTKEVQHIGLSKGKREEIAAKLQQGISRDKI